MCFFKKPIVEPETIKPTSLIKVTGDRIRQVIRAKFPEGDIYLSDKEYLLCAYDDIALFLAQDETNKMNYVPEERDCDDFSYRLMGQFSIPDWSALAFGIIWTEKPYAHALNCMIDENRNLWFVEPQNDEIKETLSETEETKVRFIIM